jgi:putative flippase GtrA
MRIIAESEACPRGHLIRIGWTDMKILDSLKGLTFRTLFIEPTNRLVIQAFRYVFVGGIAFVADWLTLFGLARIGLHYLLAAALAFLVGLTVNYFLSKKFVFVEDPEKVNKKVEFLMYGLIGLAGLLLTEGLMYLFTDILSLHYLLSKVVAAIIVLGWNFIARKMILYRKADKNA